VRRGYLLLVVALGTVSLSTVPAHAAPVPRPGQLDPSFAGGKLVSQEVTPGWDWAKEMSVQPDGKIVVVGIVSQNGQYSSNDAGIVRFTANGALDTGFANGGKLVIDKSHEMDQANGVVVQPDGKIVVVGLVTLAGATGPQGFVLRLLADGTPDPSFQGGMVLLAAAHTGFEDVALQADGKIVVSGFAGSSLVHVLVARFNADGSLDGGFGTGGSVSPGQPGAEFDGETLALTPDGRIVVAGTLYTSQHSDAAVVRFTPSGALDGSFGDAGLVRTSVATPTLVKGARIDDMVIDGQGRPVLVGDAYMYDDQTEFPPGTARSTQARRFVESDVLLLRYLPDGRLDPTFSGDGKSYTPIPTQLVDVRAPGLTVESPMSEQEAHGRGIALDPQGRLLVAGSAAQPGASPSVMRFSAGGILDPSFGLAGLSTITLAVEPVSQGWFSDLVLLPDGRIIAAGNFYDEKNNAFVIARYLPPGTGSTSVWAWGWNGAGQLGDGTTSDRPRPVKVPNLSDVVGVSAGGYHTLALKGDGTVWAWGWNGVGQLGDGTTVNRPAPVRVPGLSGVVAISAGTFHSLALLGDGTVRAWGWNYFGQLGDDTTVDRSSPVAVPNLRSVMSIAGGGMHSLASTDNGHVFAWGYNALGQLGDQTTRDRHLPTESLFPECEGCTSFWESRVNAGMYHSMSLATQPRASSWGWNHFHQISEVPSSPEIVTGKYGFWQGPVMRSVGGGLHSLILTDRGQVFAYGSNGAGQAGLGTITEMAPVPATPIPGLIAREVAAGVFHNLVVASDLTVRAWGWNAIGQLGDGTTLTRTTPVVVPGLSHAVGVSAGATHSLALVVS